MVRQRELTSPSHPFSSRRRNHCHGAYNRIHRSTGAISRVRRRTNPILEILSPVFPNAHVQRLDLSGGEGLLVPRWVKRARHAWVDGLA